jgi:hypothetical protein
VETALFWAAAMQRLELQILAEVVAVREMPTAVLEAQA